MPRDQRSLDSLPFMWALEYFIYVESHLVFHLYAHIHKQPRIFIYIHDSISTEGLQVKDFYKADLKLVDGTFRVGTRWVLPWYRVSNVILSCV